MDNSENLPENKEDIVIDLVSDQRSVPVDDEDWMVEENYRPPPREWEGILHESVLSYEDDEKREYIYPTATGNIPAVIVSKKAFKYWPHGLHKLTTEERSRGGKISTPKKKLFAYLNGLSMRSDLTPRQKEYVEHIKNNDMVSLIKQLTADLLSASDDPDWLHMVYKDIIKMIPKQTIVDMHITKDETKTVDLASLGLNPDQQSKLADYMLSLIDHNNEDIKEYAKVLDIVEVEKNDDNNKLGEN